MDSAEGVQAGGYESSLEEVAANFAKLRQLSSSYDEVTQQLRPLESAKLKVSVAYSIASLQFILLQMRGGVMAQHPIQDDISRIKECVQTINTLEKEPPRKNAIDEAAAARMIQFQLNKNIAALHPADSAPPKKKRKKT
jgi:exosome complex protein LRP1